MPGLAPEPTALRKAQLTPAGGRAGSTALLSQSPNPSAAAEPTPPGCSDAQKGSGDTRGHSLAQLSGTAWAAPQPSTAFPREPQCWPCPEAALGVPEQPPGPPSPATGSSGCPQLGFASPQPPHSLGRCWLWASCSSHPARAASPQPQLLSSASSPSARAPSSDGPPMQELLKNVNWEQPLSTGGKSL